MNKKDKYVAYFAANNEYQSFETEPKALEWLHDCQIDNYNEEIPSETTDGYDFIARIIKRSKYVIEGNREDYCKCDLDNEDCSCDLDEWPISDSYDTFGEVVMEDVEQ